MKLKTLKQMDMIEMEERKGFIEEVVRVEELKAEAIKHAKHCQHYSYVGELAWIMNFFNITEEDLK